MSTPLQIQFAANTDQARNAIANLASTVVTNMLTIGSAMKTAADHAGKLQTGIAAIPTALRTAAAGFVAFEAIKLSMEAVANAAEAAKQKLAEIVKVANDAQRAGVGTNFFQQWASQADQLSTSAERLVGMLNRAREASNVSLGTGGNPNSSFMQALLGEHVAAGNIGQGDLDAFNSAGSQEERIKAILNLVDKLTTAGKQLAALDIGKGMFGADFEAKLRDGVNITQRMRDSLKETKDVAFPPDVIARGVEINNQLELAEKKMREGWLPVQQDILRWQQDELASLATLKRLVADVAVLLGGWYTSIKSAGEGLSDFANKLPGIKAFADWTKNLPEGVFGRLPGVQPITATESAEASARRTLANQLNPSGIANAQAQSRARGGMLPTPFLPDTSHPRGGTTTSGSQTDEVETYLNSLQKAVEVLKAENETFGKSNTLKAEAVDLEKALAAARTRGTPLTDAEREAVKRLADQEGAAKDKAEQLQRAQQALNAQAQLAGDQMISVLDKIREGGARATDIIKDMTNALIKAIEQAAFLGTGPFASLFGLQGANGNTGGLAGALAGGVRGLFPGGGMSLAEGELGQAGPGFAEAAALHSGGGWAGTGPRVPVPAGFFAGARRFADGGGIPAILHAGEIVLNAAQQKNVAGSIGTTINVHNYAGEKIQTREVTSGNGQRRVDVIVGETIASGIQTPQAQSAMRSVYGARPAVARR